MDHQARSAGEVAISPFEKAHQGHASRIDSRLAEKDETALWLELGVEADVLTDHARDFRIAAER